MSNPISFSNSLGLKSFVTAEELRAVAAVPCFLSSYVFCAFFLASTAVDIIHRYGVYHFL